MYIRACPLTESEPVQPKSLPHGLKTRESLILFRKYDILKCVYWINFNKYKKVCLQFPDDLLCESVDICSLIEERSKQKVYILADTTYGSCCVDYIAAKHIGADAIIHFGSSCLSATYEIPTLYVFPKEYLDVQASCDTIRFLATNVPTTIVVLYDVAYDHCADDLTIKLLPLRPKVRVSRLAVPQQNKDSLKTSPNDVIITQFGRCYSLPRTENSRSVIYVYLTPYLKQKNFENFVLTSQNMTFYRYCGEQPGSLEKGVLFNAVKSRLYDITRVREAKRIGILVSTLSTDRYLEAIDRIKKLCQLWNKRSYIFSFGKISPEKLANFPEICLFVLIGCPEATITDRKSFYQPIVGMLEVEIALNKNEVSWQNVINDYREFLDGGSQYKTIDEQEIKESTETTDVSLLNNAVIGTSAPSTGRPEADESVTSKPAAVEETKASDSEKPVAGESTIGSYSEPAARQSDSAQTDALIGRSSSEEPQREANDSKAVAVRAQLAVTECRLAASSIERSWQGLQPNVGDTPVEKAVEGRRGTPAAGYAHPTSSQDRT